MSDEIQKTDAPPKKQKIQASSVESAKRTQLAIDLLLTGLSSQKVNNHLQAEYNLSYEGARVYINKAIATFEQENVQDKAKLRSKLHNMYMDLYNRSHTKEHYKTCKDILDSVAKMGGLHNAEETPNNTQPIQINFQPIAKKD